MAIERWLDETGVVSTKVWVGQHSYMLERRRIAGNLGEDGPREPEGSDMDTSSNGAPFIRRVNDSVYDVLAKLDVEDGEFWCECNDPDCEERVVLTLREYVALRDRNGEPLLSRLHVQTAHV
jgi:hypothetical protein